MISALKISTLKNFGHAWRRPGGFRRVTWFPLACLGCGGFAVCLLASMPSSHAQVFTVGAATATGKLPAFHPTDVQLPDARLDERTRQLLIRVVTSEQGFATRPIPRGGKGVQLHANGPMTPDAGGYQKALYEKGVSAGAGDRLIITNMTIKGDRIVLEINGGPDRKHKYLRHLSVGMDPNYTMPVVPDDPNEPTGARITLVFQKFVPKMTGADLKALLAPVIDFGVKSPVQAFTDTLPPKLRDAILAHRVLVGMNRRMVMAAMGQPESKIREKQTDGWDFEEWIYGKPPQDVNFVRLMGDRVVRVEVAAQGKALVVWNHDQTDGYLSPTEEREVAQGGDAAPGHDPGQDAPPTLRKSGEPAPATAEQKVQFPEDKKHAGVASGKQDGSQNQDGSQKQDGSQAAAGSGGAQATQAPSSTPPAPSLSQPSLSTPSVSTPNPPTPRNMVPPGGGYSLSLP